MTNDKATTVAKWATSTFLTSLGIAALSVALAVAPAQAKKQQPPADAAIADIDSGDPLFLVVSTGAQKVDIYRGTRLVTSSQVSTGMPAHPTFLGAFSILEKQRWHHSNIYSGAPMPWMNRITWSGTALHAGIVPGYPASHGCIRLPYSFAPKLYDITSVGDNVVISKDRPAPVLIEHPNLFQPLPPPPPPAMVKQEQTKQRQSSNDLLILPVAAELARPVVLAKAEVGGVTTDIPSDDLGSDDNSHATTLPKTPVGADHTPVAPAPAASTAQASEAKPAAANETVGAGEDTRTHAIDPSATAGAPDGAGNHAIGVAVSSAQDEHATAETSSASASNHALGSDDDDRPASVAAAPAAATPAPSFVPAVILNAAATVATAVEVAAAPAPVAAPAPEAPPAPVTPPPPAAVEAAPAVAPVVAAAAPEAQPVPAPATPEAAPAPMMSVVSAAAPEAQPAAAPEAPATLPMAAEAAPAPAPDAPPTAVEIKLDAGTKAAALQAAEPRSTAPLRILVTRHTQRDRVIGVQSLLADLGYLERQDFDGTLGKASVTAIKAFQKANNMPETGAFTDDLVKKVYEVAGKGEPPLGHIFVRQEFGRVFDAPVGLKNPDEPLGTHVYTALKFAPGDTKTRWIAVTVQGGSPASVLDRIEIPDDIRQRISERLTPGSTLIVGDTSINSGSLPKGGDFMVLAKYSSPTTANATSDDDSTDQPKKRARTVRRNTYNYSYGYNTQRNYQQQPQRTFRSYPSWPW